MLRLESALRTGKRPSSGRQGAAKFPRSAAAAREPSQLSRHATTTSTSTATTTTTATTAPAATTAPSASAARGARGEEGTGRGKKRKGGEGTGLTLPAGRKSLSVGQP